MTSDRYAGSSPVDRSVRRLHGLDELRAWVEANGFSCAENPMRYRENECDWYAYRRSKLDARRCECNDDKPGMQIVVTPSSFELNGVRHESVEAELCGEFGGVWWKMTAYSLKPGEIAEKLSDVEAALIVAWNALSSNASGNSPQPEDGLR